MMMEDVRTRAWTMFIAFPTLSRGRKKDEARVWRGRTQQGREGGREEGGKEAAGRGSQRR